MPASAQRNSAADNYLKNLPEFLKHKAEDCSLHTCNLLKRNFNMELVLSCRHLLEVVGVFRDLVTVTVTSCPYDVFDVDKDGPRVCCSF